ncbi:MAG: hypothetical protein ABIG96_04825 [Candidatus Micrarchaeota archaeon]
MVDIEEMGPFFMLFVMAIIILNMHLGISYSDMLMPFRSITGNPAFFGVDSVLLLSAIIIFGEKYWHSIGWLVTFVFVFGLIWILG